ncbi:murein biosynthesis integral membrane protein MurJ [Pelagibacterium xiamenense]|uniref:murein biosynthesis integral membrane protein MurJ n=1 Tax=Pelagibacterium xiamenense TaxID=2901140 RepID=UPI001E50740D|nr:murein biosynthesis integral membrane protein MurJ [Pelagibacterium xiamenense]MCD7058489.1 murein biosynthesis integral membrane protein MurJ [Pelagibacterium xiamenense]
MSLYRNFFSVSALTLVSRVFGFVRDMLMAGVLGTGPAADAFFAAFRFPNLFRRLFAEGVFNTAFVPIFSGALEQQGKEAAREIATRIVSWLIVFLVIVTILAEIFMEAILVPFVPGFLDDPEKFELTVLLTRICFPYLACMSLMAAYGGILNGLGRFLAAAFAPVLLNIATIIVLVGLVLYQANDPAFDAIWVTIGVMAGGVVQLALVVWALAKTGFMPRFTWPVVDKSVQRFWFLAIPAMLAGGITQINIFVGTIIASQADSAISYLYYADRLYQLPLGIIGIAISVVLLPELSRHLKGGRLAEAETSQNTALLISMLLSLPAATALAALATPIISVLFERGAFDAAATRATADALVAFALGLPAFVLIKVFQPGFFAREDTVTPTVIAGVSVVVNIAISLALFPAFQHVGIAIATTVSAWVNTIALAFLLARRGHFRLPASQIRRHAMILGVALAMALVLWLLAIPLAPWLAANAGTLQKIVALGVLIAVGLAVYFALVHLTGIQKLGTLLARLRRTG